jgi:hypothetical protein
MNAAIREVLLHISERDFTFTETIIRSRPELMWHVKDGFFLYFVMRCRQTVLTFQ